MVNPVSVAEPRGKSVIPAADRTSVLPSTSRSSSDAPLLTSVRPVSLLTNPVTRAIRPRKPKAESTCHRLLATHRLPLPRAVPGTPAKSQRHLVTHAQRCPAYRTIVLDSWNRLSSYPACSRRPLFIVLAIHVFTTHQEHNLPQSARI